MAYSILIKIREVQVFWDGWDELALCSVAVTVLGVLVPQHIGNTVLRNVGKCPATRRHITEHLHLSSITVRTSSLASNDWFFLGARLRNCEKRPLASSYLSVCLSVFPRWTTRLPLDGFSLNLYLSIFRKYVEKIQFWLKSDKNKGYFTWKTVYIYDNTSQNSSYGEKCFRQML
jgi:hypothetical protein